GPILTAQRNALSLSQKIQPVKLTTIVSNNALQTYLIGLADGNSFKACLVQGVLQGNQLQVSQYNIEQLNLNPEQRVFCIKS
ncbi:MAG: arginine N-succinyltransferase, partial [Psychromonas sp.]